MIDLWLGLAALVVLALLFIWLPVFLRSKAPSVDIDRTAENVAIFKQRLSELEKERAENNLDQASFYDLKAELEANLLDEVGEHSEHRTHKAKFSVVYPLLLTIAIPVVAVAFYFQNGFSEPLAVAIERGNTPAANETARAAAIDHLQQLKNQLEANPDDPEGWFLLARTFVSMERYQEAHDAFAVVGRLIGDHPAILSQQAQALYYLNQSQLTAEAKALLTRAEELDPQDPSMLGFAGIVAFDRNEFEQAIRLWQAALNTGKPEINREALLTAIDRAQIELANNAAVNGKGGEGSDSATTVDPQATTDNTQKHEENTAQTAGVEVLLSLAPSLQSQADPSTTVFLIAQAVDGPAMPLAAKRLTVADLPQKILLNDSNAMSPMARLSSVSQTKVKAIVSFSGSAGSNAGDFVGQSAPVSLSAEDVQTIELVIDQIVK